jgi:hypothetical protein
MNNAEDILYDASKHPQYSQNKKSFQKRESFRIISGIVATSIVWIAFVCTFVLFPETNVRKGGASLFEWFIMLSISCLVVVLAMGSFSNYRSWNHPVRIKGRMVVHTKKKQYPVDQIDKLEIMPSGGVAISDRSGKIIDRIYAQQIGDPDVFCEILGQMNPKIEIKSAEHSKRKS